MTASQGFARGAEPDDWSPQTTGVLVWSGGILASALLSVAT
ncbi:hypothetical protein [Halomontanus rarus]|nr:hypothetical protein [Halovivax sp. TS33]